VNIIKFFDALVYVFVQDGSNLSAVVVDQIYRFIRRMMHCGR